MDFIEEENRDAVRMSWNIWPSTRLDNTRIVVPLGVMYSPLKQTSMLHTAHYDPVRCRSGSQCEAILNPMCYVDFRSKSWTCNFCGYRNPFPPMYAERISETCLPAECQKTTIEYVLPQQTGHCQPPAFLFVLDSALNQANDVHEFEKAKDVLQQTLQSMPQNALVGFITYGAMVNVMELGCADIVKSYAFRGTKSYSQQQVAVQLGMAVKHDPRGAAGIAGAAQRRFLMPVAECEFAFNAILDDLQKDKWPTGDSSDKRTARCTGAALGVAIGLMENLYSGNAGRIIMISSGPCTIGPGKIVSQDKSEMMRSHLDLQKGHTNAQYTENALKEYANLASRAVAAGHCIDIFNGSLDQVGLHEMRVLCDRTGGCMVMNDAFSAPQFRDSMQRLLCTVDENGHLYTGFNAKMQTICSKEFRVQGCVGGCCSTGKNRPQVADTEIGESGTIEWSMGAVDPGSTYAFYFDIVQKEAPENQNQYQQQQQSAYLQFQTLYHHSSGRKRLRVTTLRRPFAQPNPQPHEIAPGFDQECAAVVMARYGMYQMENTDAFDVLRKLDRVLIRLVSKFANYNKDDVASFKLSQEFTLFPQFLFNLRRSQFLNTFGASPDETAFCRTCLLKENVMNALVMIQPALMEYTLGNEHPQPVLLDSCSLKPDVILLLDDFFRVVIWRGEQVQQWYDAEYDKREDFAHFKAWGQQAGRDALAIIKERMPAPRYIQTHHGGSQARFLVARVNPSQTHTQNPHASSTDSSTVITDDVSLRIFNEALIKHAVQS